jgi:hypothetical protein
MDHDYSNTPHGEMQNTIRIVEACLLAGKPDLIVPRLRQGCRAAAVEAELAREATAAATAGTSSPDRTTARAPAAISDALAAAIERRFRAQNRRPGS